jgi:hypothetical protein
VLRQVLLGLFLFDKSNLIGTHSGFFKKKKKMVVVGHVCLWSLSLSFAAVKFQFDIIIVGFKY